MILRFPSSSSFEGRIGGNSQRKSSTNPCLLLLLLLSVSSFLPTFIQAQSEEECAVFLGGEQDSFTNDDLAPITINTDDGLCYSTLTWPQIELDFDEDSTVSNDDDGDCCGFDRKNRRRQREVRASIANSGRRALSRSRQLQDDINIRNTGSIQLPGGLSSFVICDEYRREYIVVDDESPVILGCPDESVLPYQVPMRKGECYYDGQEEAKTFGTIVVTDNCGVRNLFDDVGGIINDGDIKRGRRADRNRDLIMDDGASLSSSSEDTRRKQQRGSSTGRNRNRNKRDPSSGEDDREDGMQLPNIDTIYSTMNTNGTLSIDEKRRNRRRNNRKSQRNLQDMHDLDSHIVNDIVLDEDVGGGGTIHTKVYAYQDENGNRVECPVTFVAIDDQPPTIDCPEPDPIEADNCESAYYEPEEPIYDDNCGINGLVITNDFPDDKIFPIGENTYHYFITDADGNEAMCDVVINVIPNIEDEIVVTCPNSATGTDTCNGSTGMANEPALANDPGLCGKVVNYETDLQGDFSFEYRCDNVCVDLTHESGTFFPVGEAVTVTYTVTDSDGDSGKCSFDIEISDVEPPVITECPRDVQVPNEEGECTGIVEWCSPIAHDNCAGELRLASVASSTSEICGVLDDVEVDSGDSFPVGISTVTHYVFDDAENRDSCQQQVEVIDTEPPTFGDGCPRSEDMMRNAQSDCSATVEYTVRADDNCEGLGGNVILENLTPEYYPGAVFPHGEHQVRWSATDLAGNVAYCEFTVTIFDSIDLEPGRIDCDTKGIIPVNGKTTMSPTYPPKENGCPTFTKLSCPTCQLCTYEGTTFDLAASNDCGVEISSGTLTIYDAGDIGTFIGAQVVITDLEEREISGTCTVCVDDGRRRLIEDSDEREVERTIEHRRTRSRGEKRSLKKTEKGSGSKGSDDYYYSADILEIDECHEPVLGSTQFLGSVSQCGRRRGSSYSSSSKGGSSKGSGSAEKIDHRWYCPPSWDPLNDQFTCEMNPDCEVVID